MLTPAPTADQQQLIDLRSMYRVIHVLGTDLPPTQVQQHRQAIHDLVHPAAGSGRGTLVLILILSCAVLPGRAGAPSVTVDHLIQPVRILNLGRGVNSLFLWDVPDVGPRRQAVRISRRL